MDPEMWMAMQAYYMNGGDSPALFNTGYAPNPDAPELEPYAQYLLGTGMMPNTNKYGELLPYNMDYQRDIMNTQQDMYGTLADPVNAYMSSLAGGEGFAPGVFDPVTKETPIEVSQAPMLQTMMMAGGYQGTLAKLMLPKQYGGQGMNPGTAIALLQRAVNNPEAAAQTGIDPAAIEQIKGELPPLINNQGINGPEIVEGQYDWRTIAQDAQSMWQPMAQEQAKLFDPTGNLRPGVISRDGQFFSTEQIDSPQTEFLKKLGIPNPNARYDLEYALQNDPAVAGLFQHQAETTSQADSMRKTFEQYTKKIAKQREQEAKTRQEDARKIAEYEANKAKKMGEYKAGPLQQWSDRADLYAATNRQAMTDYFREATQAGAPRRLPNQDATDQRNRRMAEFQPELLAEAGRRGFALQEQPAAWESGRGIEGLVKMPERPEAPTFEKPDLSLYSRGEGMTADEVAELFNASQRLMEKMPLVGKRPRQALSGQKQPLAQAMNAANTAERETGISYMKALIPYLARNAAGRTPAKDVIQQRMQPMYASGAWGQQGMPTAYPNRNAVMAAFGG